MKKIFQLALLMLVVVLFTSCAADPGCITWGQAWHAAWSRKELADYRLWAIVGIIGTIAIGIATPIVQRYVKIKNDFVWWLIGFVLAFILFMSTVILPILNMMSTTIEMYNRGVILR